MNNIKFQRKQIATISAVLLIVVMSLWWRWAMSPVAQNNETLYLFEVKKGENVRQVAKNLKRRGLINDPVAFFIIVRLNNLGKNLQAGDFQLSPNMPPLRIAQLLTLGRKDAKVTIPEGWRKEEIAERLVENLEIDKYEFIKLAKEGYMFPDTYLFPQEATATEIVKIFLDNFENKFDDAFRRKATETNLTESEVVILASIVEREAKHDIDRPIIAGILTKRLKNNWPLEADATVQYALGFQAKEQRWWKRELNENDLKVDSPYNTRLYPGLPPSPIANPGLSALKAVVDPKETPYWFYLSGTDGKTHYALTLEEHNKNIKEFLSGTPK